MLFATPELEPLDEEVIERVLELRQALRLSLAQRRRWTGVVRRMTLAEAVRGSNDIEGYRVSSEDALAAVERDQPVEASEDGDAWAATMAYQRAMTYVLQLHDDPHFTWSADLIRSLHFMLVEYDLEAMPGRWRPGPVFVNDTATGEVVYEGPEASAVPALMSEFTEALADEEAPPLVRGAMAHLNMAMVHPFKDGNGRIARVVQSLVLAREGMLSAEFCSIEEYLGRHTRDYYDVLAEVGGGSWHPDNDACPWVRFTLTAHFRQARVLMRRVEEANRIWGLLDEALEKASLPERAAGPLYLAAHRYRIGNEAYRANTGVSAGTASRDLRELVKAGLLDAEGEKRGRTYVASKRLRSIVGLPVAAARAEERLDPYADPHVMEDPYAQPHLFDES